MPLIVYATNIAGDGEDEAFKYSIVTSLMNVCGILSEELSAGISDFTKPITNPSEQLFAVSTLTETWSMGSIGALLWLM